VIEVNNIIVNRRNQITSRIRVQIKPRRFPLVDLFPMINQAEDMICQEKKSNNCRV
jgi:hypothetical protein